MFFVFFFFFFVFSSPDVSIDLGTANILLYEKGRGVVLDEPSVIAIIEEGGERYPCAFGEEAKRMLGKTPSKINAVRPMKDGVIANFRDAEDLIHHFIQRPNRGQSFIKPLIGPLVIICVPSGSTPVERRAIQESAENAGAREVYLIEEPMAAAIGAFLPVNEPRGSLIVDIGGGTTEVGITSLGGLVHSNSVRVGGDKMDASIVSYIRRNQGLLIGDGTAEDIKKQIGTAPPAYGGSYTGDGCDDSMLVRGRDLATGVPKEITVTRKQISQGLQECVDAIVEAVLQALENAPPELSADIVGSGITLSGGGAKLINLDKVLNEATNLPVHIAKDPLLCVVNGTGIVLEDMKTFRGVLFKEN